MKNNLKINVNVNMKITKETPISNLGRCRKCGSNHIEKTHFRVTPDKAHPNRWSLECLECHFNMTTDDEADLIRLWNGETIYDMPDPYTAERKEINVGDEVWNKDGDCKAVVMDQSGEGVYFVLTENRCIEEWEQRDFVKSGKNHGEVDELVEKLREEE